MAEEIAVLIVDDSALMRGLIGRMVEDTPGLAVADKAMNGRFALQKIDRVNPDVIVLDLEMPEMNGIEFLRERRRRGIRIPVVILSSLARRGAEITMEALALGASDFVQKPSGSVSENIRAVKDTLTGMLRAYGASYRRARPQGGFPSAAQGAGNLSRVPGYPQGEGLPPERVRQPGAAEVVAIGVSTGGPDALRVVFSGLDSGLKTPILVVQHMPPGFTAEFARSLDKVCPLEVKEAKDGDLVRPGRVLIAQGNRHLEVERQALAVTARLSDGAQVSGHRPSADVLFASVARVYRNHAVGVIMTGMGRDGAAELGAIYREGGVTLGQDEESAVVYGMPRAAWEMGHVMEQVSLTDMARRICAIAMTAR
jgi:two-component system chemotaxis response regulator CheB